MSNNQKWIKELSDFFAKDENWDIACETIEAVERVETYWKEQFWLNVYQQFCEQLDEDLWAVRKDGEEVDIHPKYDKCSVEESCCIMILCAEKGGCSYSIWIDQDDYKHSQNKESAEFFERQGLVDGDKCFYSPQIALCLDRAQLGKGAKNNFEDAKKLVKETVQFIQNSNVRDMILGMGKK